MNKHELKSLLENIYSTLTEAESSPYMTPEGPDGEAIPWDYRPMAPLNPNSLDDLNRIPSNNMLKPGEGWYWTGSAWIIISNNENWSFPWFPF